ncbi:hypothetical protein BRADI_1g04975v3 [Brachypodium distachyon]|uniref:Uncharacterized protein n=1 Tax=Brachypodium distachyon TaxID=15368 RepID=A0A2K2DI45_BRADI|nr:hypothetical protein BRADI_1g04975v3 [Brachypodium distachyon]
MAAGRGRGPRNFFAGAQVAGPFPVRSGGSGMAGSGRRRRGGGDGTGMKSMVFSRDRFSVFREGILVPYIWYDDRELGKFLKF